jgi:hypothetical protein
MILVRPNGLEYQQTPRKAQALRQPQLSERRAGASAINIRNNAQLQYSYVIKVHRINFSLMNRTWRAEVVLLADYLLVGQPFVT